MRISDWSSDVCSSDLGSRAAELVIPAAVWGRADDGTRWVTTIAPGGSPEPDITRLPAGSTNTAEAAPGRITVAPSRPASWWCEPVAPATAATAAAEIGRASRRARVCQYGENSVAAQR